MTTHTITADQVVPTCVENYYAVNARFNCGPVPGCSIHTRYRITFSPEGIPARRVQHGPMHPEFFADLSADAAVLTDHHIPDDRPVITLAVGDRIAIEGFGIVTVVAPDRWHHGYPTLTAVAS